MKAQLQKSSGIDPRNSDHRAKIDENDPQYNGYGFADVRRACHRWLMGRDENYRKGHEARQEARTITTP